MEKLKNHIIHKVLVDFQTSDEEIALHVKKYISSFLEQELFPVLEEYLEQINLRIHKRHLQVPTLSIDLSSSKDLIDSFGKTKNKLVLDHVLNQFKVQLEQQLKQWERNVIGIENLIEEDKKDLKGIGEDDLSSDPHVKLFSGVDRDVKSILYVFKNGKKPWWIGEHEEIKFFTSWKDIGEINYLFEVPIFKKFLLEISEHKEFFERLVNQFTNLQLAILYGQLVNTNRNFSQSKNYKDWVKSIPNEKLRNEFWRLNWIVLSKKSYQQEFVSQSEKFWQKAIKISPESYLKVQLLLNEIHQFASSFHGEKFETIGRSFLEFNENLSKLKAKKGFGKESFSKRIEVLLFDVWKTKDLNKGSFQKKKALSPELSGDEETRVIEEGLQLDQAGLVLLHSFIKPFFKNVGLLDEKNQLIDKTTAVHLLHFLATKNEEVFEHEMLFEKYCCNFPLNQTMERTVVLSKTMKDAAEELLSDAIGHWKVLRNTGSDTIRSEFLCRRGKLSLQGNHHKLMIERKPQDILLDQLPWSISLVKFPWRKELLFVEW